MTGIKISENQSPRPQDRFFFTGNYFADVNGALNRRFESPVTAMRVYREIFGVEKTFDGGNGSIGLRLPIDSLKSNPTVPARFAQYGGMSTAVGDLDVFVKYILKQDSARRNLISAGFGLTAPTGPSTFAGASYLGTGQIHTLLLQPFLGYIWNPGKFYAQGFTALEFPVNPDQVTQFFNDLGIGYFLLRSPDPTRFVTAIAPTFEVHVNTPLNHRDVFNPNDPAGTPDVVNLTYGLNMEVRRNSLITFAFANPVTGPRPFAYEVMLLFNYRFGRGARPAAPPVPPVSSG